MRQQENVGQRPVVRMDARLVLIDIEAGGKQFV